jgi:hypothetical protein
MTEATDNGKVTLAILNTNLLHLTNEVKALRDDICTDVRDHETRLRSVEFWRTTSQEKWDAHAEVHRSLTVKQWTVDVIGAMVRRGPC